MLYFLVYSMIRYLSRWLVPVFLLGYCMITLKVMFPAFKLVFDVLSVICRLHNLRPTFKIHFIYFHPLFSRLGHTLFFIWRPYATCQGMALVSRRRFPDNHRLNASLRPSKSATTLHWNSINLQDNVCMQTFQEIFNNWRIVYVHVMLYWEDCI